ncbi:inositol monophosphatase [Mesorhizobium sp. BR1-1-16]|uniref:inositol monophosphatase family protein n=1 Tax=Mesorhizobium sp. BR1-1-16 TaxID=2876653 RepID=UPI001CCC6254|nr:inositol monophosphatase [Mesorhizobium sp. BR1-1-16]MBZ9935173.1 inositol monophosphatase [Mesorhizobium sp. BR1-1-16]
MTFSARDIATVAEILNEAATAEILPRFRRLSAGAVREKTSAEDLVTDADVAAEKRITAALEQAFPGAVVLGEEAVSEHGEGLLDALADAPLAFVVDPVDGTRNFASGLTLFGVMTGVVAKGEIVAGVILDPIGKDWSVALRGEGAWTETADGGRLDLKVAKPKPVDEMSGFAAWWLLEDPLRSQLAANLARTGSVSNYRCAAHEYRLLAGGHAHFSAFSKLMVWDHAAGWLLHQEAGGFSARYDGSPYSPLHRAGGLLCTPDEESWHALHAALFAGTEYARV